MRITTILLVLLATTTVASAQVTFPADGAFAAFRCGNDNPMTDAFADVTGFLNESDIVGDDAHPAGLRASDSTNLYLRIRLEEDPAPAGAVANAAWGVEIDVNNNQNNYEVLIMADGKAGTAGQVAVYHNSTTTQNNDPNDPADSPPIAMYPFADNARTVQRTDTNIGGSADYFLDIAVPWNVLEPIGLHPDTLVHVWVASSSSAVSLNGDFACHDGTSGGAVTLTGTTPDTTTGDPTQDPGPGGGGGTGRLEGGGGCATTSGSGLGLALGALLLRRRRRPIP